MSKETTKELENANDLVKEASPKTEGPAQGGLTKEKSFGIITTAVERANKAGCFSLEESTIIFQALQKLK